MHGLTLKAIVLLLITMLVDPVKKQPKFKFLVENDDDVSILKMLLVFDPEPV